MFDRITGLLERIMELPVAPIEKVRAKYGMTPEAICVVIVGVVYFLPVHLFVIIAWVIVGILQDLFAATSAVARRIGGCNSADSKRK